MEVTAERCPACGKELNLKTDSDYFYCPYCGNKIANSDAHVEIPENIEDEKVDLEESGKQNPKSDIWLKVVAVIVFVALLIGLMYLGFVCARTALFGPGSFRTRVLYAFGAIFIGIIVSLVFKLMDLHK